MRGVISGIQIGVDSIATEMIGEDLDPEGLKMSVMAFLETKMTEAKNELVVSYFTVQIRYPII